MQNEQFITIQGWMRNELGLKGNELLVYALIYGFSQDEESEFTGSIGYIADWTGATKQTVHNTLKSLHEKELLHKEESFIKGVKYCSYRAILPPVKKFDGGSQKILPGVVKKFDGSSQKILPNSIEDNIERKNKNTNSSRFIPPTVQEVKAYCIERKNDIDAEQFVDFYQSKGWKIGSGKMKDWKAALRTWEKRQKKEQSGSDRLGWLFNMQEGAQNEI